MMLPSHLLATVLLGLLACHAWRPFTRTQWLLALGFGVLIDLDHLVQLPAYVALHGAAALSPGDMLQWGSQWQGFMHRPGALVLVTVAALLARSTIPLAFWSLHMVQDFVIARHHVVWGSPAEWLVVMVLCVTVLAVLWLGHRTERADGRTLLRHVALTFGVAR